MKKTVRFTYQRIPFPARDGFPRKGVRNILLFLIPLLTLFAIPSRMRGEEGFWLFSDPPSARIEADYGVTLSDPFLTHLQRGAVRLNVGGSGSFVSPDGLVMTNYHCVFDVVSYYDASGNDYLQNGFYAPTMEEEIPCVGMTATVLIDWEDVTDQIVSGTDRETEEGRAEQRKRRSELETSEKERTGLNCRVESFFEGYFLYRYRIFDDLRLVFAPERTIGLFGGDADNFEYPRYNFDVAFLRVYQDGTPYHPTDYFRWSPNGAVPGELLFVSGNPGHSERFKTAADLELVRDSLPFTIHRLESQEASFQRKIQEGEEQGENTARLQKHLVYCQNGIKMWKGRLLALENPSILARKREEERELFRQMTEEGTISGDPWGEIEEAITRERTIFLSRRLLVEGEAFDYPLYLLAKLIVLLARESEKPVEERLAGYRTEEEIAGNREVILESQLTEDPEAMERFEKRLVASLNFARERITHFEGDVEDREALLDGILAGRSPEERGRELTQGSALWDPEFRRRLVEGGLPAVNGSDDPVIRLALWVESISGPVRETQKSIDSQLRSAYGRLLPALAQREKPSYPDADFTLRLSYGKIAGYETSDGTPVPPKTTVAGLYDWAERHDFAGDYALPSKWGERRATLDPETPVDFISTNDIIGGNSGSPVLNARGEVVGLVFDGNQESLAFNYFFTEERARTISVDSVGILAVLAQIYQADRLLDEIEKAAE